MMIGKPNIPNLIESAIDPLISFGGAFAINMVFGNQWGIFTQFGVPILLVDTVYSVKYQNSNTVSQAPLERGTFASYNKVQDPYKATVALVRGGSDPAMRGALIAQLEALANSTQLFNIVTPDFVHANATITGYDYARDPQAGARMIVANVHLQEIRETAVAYETQITEQASDAATVDVGEVQPTVPGESALLKATNKIRGWLQ